ncbi:recQ-mediated genome instability protein 1, partial [Nephila pilipes]
MLMLNLTDGCIHIQGMEYKPIHTLSPNLPPGTKVLIQGPIDCRLGVLLLTSEKIRILGGEVENKLITFSRKAILREALQLPPEEETEMALIDVPTNSEALSVSEESLLNRSASAPESHLTSQQQNTNPTLLLQSNTAFSRNQRIERRNENASRNCCDGRNPSTSSSSKQQSIFMSRNQNNAHINSMGNVDNLETFEEDDDFEQTLDYNVLDELEKESLNKSDDVETVYEELDIWAEDEDVIQDMMAFQDENPGFQMPFDEFHDVDKSQPFTYLYSILQNPLSDCTVTIKGFIITVLSKLECTVDKGYSLMVKINDGTASLDVTIHDK